MHNCISISRQLHNDVNPEFLQPCQKLIQYLKYIKKESSTGNHIQSCKYFSYILKNELRSFNNTCNGTKECYNKIHKTYEETSHGIDVCKKNIEEINEKTLEKFQKLDYLYDIFYKFLNSKEEGHSIKCDLGIECSKNYNDHIKLCHQVNHIGFCKALDKFKDTYNMHMKDGSQCDKVPRYLYSPFGTEKRRTFSISLITIFAMSTILFTVYKVNGILL
ncbi:hypothetical protein PVMG_03661 [Plasmodium vivax Mauritania I]|uniref:Uncharacterized protein n=1 Tax=Plasmodium vivax Mauritania I TaxID=1035515 RepID=A0A0J9TBB9_PLAVI|nr:hypothetical protein PVMG_03661 [Plasmodium vivax Mauritania I]